MKNMRFVGLSFLLFTQITMVHGADFETSAKSFLDYSYTTLNHYNIAEKRLKRLNIGIARENKEMSDPQIEDLYNLTEQMLDLVDESKHTVAKEDLRINLEEKVVMLLKTIQDRDFSITPALDNWGILGYIKAHKASSKVYRSDDYYNNQINSVNEYINTLTPTINVQPIETEIRSTSAANRVGDSSGQITKGKWLNFTSFANAAKEYFASEGNKKNFPEFVEKLKEISPETVAKTGPYDITTEKINYGYLFTYHLLIAAGYDDEDLITDLLRELKNCTAGDATMATAFNLVLNDDIKRLLYGSKLLENKDIINSWLEALRELAASTVTNNEDEKTGNTGYNDPVYTELQSVYNSLQLHIIKLRLKKISVELQAARGDYAAKEKFDKEQRELKAEQIKKRTQALQDFNDTLTKYTTDLDEIIEARKAKLASFIAVQRMLIQEKGRSDGIPQIVEDNETYDSMTYYENEASDIAVGFKEDFETFIKDDLAAAEKAAENGNDEIKDFFTNLSQKRVDEIDAKFAQIRSAIEQRFDLRQKSIGTICFDVLRDGTTRVTVNTEIMENNLRSVETTINTNNETMVNTNDRIKSLRATLRVVEEEDKIAAEQTKLAFMQRQEVDTEGRFELAEAMDDMLKGRNNFTGNEQGTIERDIDALEAARIASIQNGTTTSSFNQENQDEISKRRLAAQQQSDPKQVEYLQEITNLFEKLTPLKGVTRFTEMNKAGDDSKLKVAIDKLDDISWKTVRIQASDKVRELLNDAVTKQKLNNNSPLEKIARELGITN